MSRSKGTTVFRHGPVFVGDAARSWATAVAVQGGDVVAVGGDAEIAPFLADADDVVDLAGRLLIPGFVDAHVHPVMGGLERLRCDLTPVGTPAEYDRVIAAYVRAHPERTWVLGGGWSMGAYPDGRPTRHQLDAVVADRPVFLPNCDHHSAWVNTRALELAGIDATTPDPPDGRIERDTDGAPTGLLHEGAADLVERLVPATTQDEYDDALRTAVAYLNSLGITGWQDAMVRVSPFDDAGAGPSVHEAYLRADREDWLTARVAGALWWDRACDRPEIAEQVGRLAEFRDATRKTGRRYTAEHVKVMVDGVVETYTAALLEPYLDACGCVTANRGISFLDRDLLRDVTVALDGAGFGVHFHALGDRAVRDALDALDAARRAHGTSGRPHHLAHLQVVDPADVPRFRRLGAGANLQPLWACHEPEMDELSIPFLGGARAQRQYPFGDLHRDGALLAMGSDWPVSSPDPLLGIHVAVNRRVLDAPAEVGPLGADQRLPLGVALAAYTAGAARVSGFDDAGTVRPGTPADLVVLDRDPFDHPVDEIGHTRVARTYVAGELVHDTD